MTDRHIFCGPLHVVRHAITSVSLSRSWLFVLCHPRRLFRGILVWFQHAEVAQAAARCFHTTIVRLRRGPFRRVALAGRCCNIVLSIYHVVGAKPTPHKSSWCGGHVGYYVFIEYKLCPDPVNLSSVQYRPICELVTLTTIVLLVAHIVQTICSRMLEAES